MDIQTLAETLKTTAMTGAQIQALDSSYLCQNPAQAIQTLRSLGHTITTTTGAGGVSTYQVAA
jgi:hypothetical protein